MSHASLGITRHLGRYWQAFGPLSSSTDSFWDIVRAPRMPPKPCLPTPRLGRDSFVFSLKERRQFLLGQIRC